MAQITYNDAMSQPEGYVGFFSLPHDGDSAIVRFLHDSVDDFTIITRHEVGQGKNYRTVDCLRTPHDPMEKCPFCAANVKLAQRFFVRILRYDTDENGQVQVTPCIWERSTGFATTMKGYIDNYGPMSNIVCKIVRKGTGLNTKYEIIPNLNPDIYRPDVYVCKPELFDGYTVIGNAVLSKSAEDMRYYLQTGQFPSADNANETPIDVITPTVSMPNSGVPAYGVAPAPVSTTPVNVPPAPWGATTTPSNPVPQQTYVGDFPPAPANISPVPNVVPPVNGYGTTGTPVGSPERPVRRYS